MITADCVLVVRARSLALFRYPQLEDSPTTTHAPLAKHSFGWVDGVAVRTIISPSSRDGSLLPLSILIRTEPDDPWAADEDHDLRLYTLYPTDGSSALPYIFPPVHTANVPSTRGSLQCSDLCLGAHGTAVWVQPQDRSAAGLLHAMQEDAHAPVARKNERLMCAVFPGPLFRGDSSEVEAESKTIAPRALCVNELNNWKALDYDEVRGRVAMGSTRGKVTVLSLV